MPFVSIAFRCVFTLQCYCYYYVYIFCKWFFPYIRLFGRSFVGSFDRLVCFLFGWHFIFWCLRFRVTQNFDGLLFSAHDGSAAGQTDIIETHHAKYSTNTHLLTSPNRISSVSVQFSQLLQSYSHNLQCVPFPISVVRNLFVSVRLFLCTFCVIFSIFLIVLLLK